MNFNKKIVVLIPCRSGSKTLPNKNIMLYKNLPLFVHSIKVAQELSNIINEIYVSTDSHEYQEIALQYGAKAPFLRPVKISGDLSCDLEVFQHFIEYYYKTNHTYPDIIVHLRPTYPNRSARLLKDTLEYFITNYNDYDSLRTVAPIEKSLFKMYHIDNTNNTLVPPYRKINNINEPYNQARQLLPKTYLHNGCIDIIKTYTIISENSMSGDKILPYIMNEKDIHDIDTLEDFNKSYLVK